MASVMRRVNRRFMLIQGLVLMGQAAYRYVLRFTLKMRHSCL